MSAATRIQKGVDRNLDAVALRADERDAVLSVWRIRLRDGKRFAGCSHGISATDVDARAETTLD